jgi:hypothetical protein
MVLTVRELSERFQIWRGRSFSCSFDYKKSFLVLYNKEQLHFQLIRKRRRKRIVKIRMVEMTKNIVREGLVDDEYDDEHLMATMDIGRQADYDMKGVSVGDEEFEFFFFFIFFFFLFFVFFFYLKFFFKH